ncbi:MAG TPA: ABC transporter permease [Vicinamibacterales bacterium]|nr:ABC transporter permease [Vicinamibacterales bacterium]
MHEIRYALRSLWHFKAVALVAIVCLGLGIGINTTIFSMIDGVILKPFPYEDPTRIFVVGTQKLKEHEQSGLSLADLRDWKTANTSFTTIAGLTGGSLTIVDSAGEPERYDGARVAWDMFRLLGIHPILGRDFLESDDQPNAAGVVILSHMLWTMRYRSDPQVIGRGTIVNGAPYTIVGVMPPHFAFPDNQRLWITLQPTFYKDTRDVRRLFTFGRLRPGVSAERALADLDAIAVRLAKEYPATNQGWSARLETLHEAFLPRDVNLVLGLMMAGVTLVLFIACSNVANLLLARATARRHELAMRVALGASRWRIVRQLLTESVVLALVSLPLGLVLAAVGVTLVKARIPPDTIPYYIDFRIDVRSFAYSLVVTVLTAVVFGLVPALQLTRRELQENLKEGARGSTSPRAMVRNALVVSQVSLALVAVVGALLFVRSFRNLDTFDVGFDTTETLTARFFMTGEPYQAKGTKERRVTDIVTRVQALPGVRAAFASNLVPIQGGGGDALIEVEGRPPGKREYITLIAGTPHVFPTLGVRLRQGRDLTESDASRSVAIVNETMARQLWHGENATEHRFRIVDGERPREWITVIGVAPDLHLFGIDPNNSQVPQTAFLPYAYGEFPSTGLTIRASGNPAALAPAVRAAIRASDSNLPVFNIHTLEDVRQREYWEFAVYGWIFGTTGAVGVLLASIGVYGVLAYSVSQRTQEIGVRVTLGAGRKNVFGLIVGQGLRLTGIGVAIGLVLAAFGTPVTRSLLYKVSPFDPFSFIAVSILLMLVALLASYVPARRAMRVDPVVALRQE